MKGTTAIARSVTVADSLHIERPFLPSKPAPCGVNHLRTWRRRFAAHLAERNGRQLLVLLHGAQCLCHSVLTLPLCSGQFFSLLVIPGIFVLQESLERDAQN